MSSLPTHALRSSFVGMLLLWAPAALAQMPQVLAPGGTLRVEAAPSWLMWERRFGQHLENGQNVDAAEELGYDLENTPLVPLEDLRQTLRAALADPSLALVLGSQRAEVAKEITRVDLGAAVGLFDWLTVSFNVPFVENRTEISFDYRPVGASNLGRNPNLDGKSGSFLSALDQSRIALQARVTQQCPAGAGSGGTCPAMTDLLARYTVFAGSLATAYGVSPLFLTEASTAGQALQKRLTGFRGELAQQGITTVPATAPLATAVIQQAGLSQILIEPGAGFQLINPLVNTGGAWRMGDIEASAAFGMHLGAADSTGAPPRFGLQLGGRALVRLPTGSMDHPDVPLDLRFGDGQLDLELGGFGDLRWHRVGVRAEGRYGVQRPTTLARRVAPPEVVMVPVYFRTDVRWTPGDYWEAKASPSWYLTDEFSVGALYSYFSKAQDDFELLGSIPSPASAADLERETEVKLQEVGLGMGFSTIDRWRAGRARVPFELTMAVRHATTGSSGGNTPDGLRMEMSARVFWRLWGPVPPPRQ